MTAAPSVGTKAAGLEGLHPDWTPDFVALARATIDNLGDRTTPADRIASRLRGSSVAPKLDAIYRTAADGIIVRSSAVDEDITARGLFESRVVSFPGFLTTAEAIASIWQHASDVDRTIPPIPLVVQRYVPPRIMGHMSNERRLRPDRRDWVVELRGEGSDTRRRGLRALRGDRVALSDMSPDCVSADDLLRILRRVAGSFTRGGHRYHLEWIWDGAQVWLVQVDTISEFRSSEPRAIGWAREVPSLETFRAALPSDASFPKARCVAEYGDAGLPHQDLRLLSDASLFERILRGQDVPELRRDLAKLARCKSVVRTDIRREGRDFDVLRGRTDAGFAAEDLLKFLHQSLIHLASAEVDLSDIVFLAHPFIPADAAAWTLAAPNSSQVRVDATFGLPDGLLYYPHDSYVADLRSRSVRSQIRCKSQILVSDEHGVWRDEPLGAPWDWKPALTDTEVMTAARMSKRLADRLNKPVETMFFVRTHTMDPGSAILPWVHRDGSHRPVGAVATSSFFLKQSVEVRRRADVHHLRRLVQDVENLGERVLVHLRPEADVLHDSVFLDDLVSACPAHRCSVRLEGSTLSHIYYELVRNGIHVEISEPIATAGAEPVSFGKLVRDLIPSKIAARGEHVVAYRATGDELQTLLRQKAVEEAFEIAHATSSAELLEEVGDALDVLATLCSLAGTDLLTVYEWAGQKRQQRGSFSEGLVLVETREPSLEEATSNEPATYPVNAEIGAEVQRRRKDAESGPVVLADEIKVTYGTGATDEGSVARVRVDGLELEMEFQSDGVVLRRGRRDEHPDQLRLRL